MRNQKRIALLAVVSVVAVAVAFFATATPAKASPLTLYGHVDPATRPGRYAVQIVFRDIEDKTVLHRTKAEAVVEHGNYYAKVDSGELKAFRPYEVEVTNPDPSAPPMVEYVELQAASPGTAQTGHLNITGFVLAGRIGVGTSPSLARIQVNETGPIQGVRAITASGSSVYGQNNSATGFSSGGYFTTASSSGRALVADALSATGDTNGIRAYSRSTTGTAVWGKAIATSGTPVGVVGETLSTTGTGVVGTGPGTGGKFVSTGTGGVGVHGKSPYVAGMFESTGSSGIGVNSLGAIGGQFNGTGTNALGLTVTGRKAAEFSGTETGITVTSGKVGGIFTVATSEAEAVRVDTTNAFSVGINILSSSSSASWPALRITNRNTTSPANIVSLTNGTNGHAIVANSNRPDSAISMGTNATISGINRGTTGQAVGVYASTGSIDGFGLMATSQNVAIRCVGKLTATGTKSFVIDDPRDPLNAEIHHFCSEGPEPYNVYRGNAVLNARGQAAVMLPGYYDLINRDATYGLTPIGAPANLYVLSPVQNGRFTIAGGKPGMIVSWTVTAVRNDPYVRAHPTQVEVRKPELERGTYLAPEAYGKAATAGVESRLTIVHESGNGGARP